MVEIDHYFKHSTMYYFYPIITPNTTAISSTIPIPIPIPISISIYYYYYYYYYYS